MDAEVDTQYRRIPTLVQLCQRAAGAHVASIYSLGDISYALTKPILERCTDEQLLRFEQLSPHLEKDISEIWRDLCFRKYQMTAVERYSSDDDPQDPDSWRSRYFTLQEAEANRIEEIGIKIRAQRMEADERKKEKEVKYTDRVPPAKRPRTGGWGTIAQPKTLFQKTRSEASKVQRSINARVLPPMLTAKSYRVLPPTPGAILPPPLSSTSNRVTVNTVTVHRRSTGGSSTASVSTGLVSRDKIPQSSSPPPTAPQRNAQIPSRINAPSLSFATTDSSEPLRPVIKSFSPMKKDPMASLFVPKRKAYSQRPV